MNSMRQTITALCLGLTALGGGLGNAAAQTASTPAPASTAYYVSFANYCDVFRVELMPQSTTVMVYGHNVAPQCETESYATGGSASRAGNTRVTLIGGYAPAAGPASVLKVIDIDLASGQFTAYRLNASSASNGAPTSALGASISGRFQLSLTPPAGSVRSSQAQRPSLASAL